MDSLTQPVTWFLLLGSKRNAELLGFGGLFSTFHRPNPFLPSWTLKMENLRLMHVTSQSEFSHEEGLGLEMWPEFLQSVLISGNIGWLSHSINWKRTIPWKAYIFSLAFGSQEPECDLPPGAHPLISKSWPPKYHEEDEHPVFLWYFRTTVLEFLLQRGMFVSFIMNEAEMKSWHSVIDACGK